VVKIEVCLVKIVYRNLDEQLSNRGSIDLMYQILSLSKNISLGFPKPKSTTYPSESQPPSILPTAEPMYG
jgi:hypothetical protein